MIKNICITLIISLKHMVWKVKLNFYLTFFFLLHLVVFIYVIYSAWCILIVYL